MKMAGRFFAAAALMLTFAMLLSSCGASSQSFYNGYVLYENSMLVNYSKVGTRAFSIVNDTPALLPEKSCRLTYEDGGGASHAIDILYAADNENRIRITTVPIVKNTQTLDEVLSLTKSAASGGDFTVLYAMGYTSDRVVIAAAKLGRVITLLANLEEQTLSEIVLPGVDDTALYPLALSPDGEKIIFNINDREREMLGVYDVATAGDPTLFPNPAPTYGAAVYFQDNSTLIINGDPMPLTTLSLADGATVTYRLYPSAASLPQGGAQIWSPGVTLGESAGKLTIQTAAASSAVSTSLEVTREQLFALQGNAALSPDGSGLLVSIDNAVYLVDTRSGESREIDTSHCQTTYTVGEHIFSWIDNTRFIYNAGTTDTEGLLTITPFILKAAD